MSNFHLDVLSLLFDLKVCNRCGGMPAGREELEGYVASLMEISNLAAKDPVMAKELLLAVRCAVGEDNIMDMLDVAPKDEGDLSEHSPQHKLPRRYYSPPNKDANVTAPWRAGGGQEAASSSPTTNLANVSMEVSMLSAKESLENSMSRLAADDDAERAQRIKKLRRQSAAYPACLLITLDTVHNVDESMRWSVGDLDRAVKNAEDDVRRLRAALRNQEMLFEKLQPTSSYIDRDNRSILEQIAEEEKTSMNERGVLREQVAAKIDERNAAKARVKELAFKLDILKKHAAIVRKSVTEEYEQLVASYPHLTERELNLSSHDINRIVDERRVLIRETKQQLLKGRVKREHTLASTHRQIAEKEVILRQLMLEVGDDPMSPLLQSPTSPPAEADDSGVMTLPPLLCAAASPPAKSSITRSRFDLSSPGGESNEGSLRRVTSLELLTSIRKNASRKITTAEESTSQHFSPSKGGGLGSLRGGSISQSPARSAAARDHKSAKDPQTLVEAETEARRQLNTIFKDSWNLLASDFHIELLKLQERAARLSRGGATVKKYASGILHPSQSQKAAVDRTM